ncbi:MAG TPA: hypothetical protein VK029_08355 [Pseudogracilibacillus sp.]|nr:hypothetical protein [Pseudogracilibacillus sp.]
MIIQVKGKVKFPITIDPSVWIFDDRKIKFLDAFSEMKREEEEDHAKKTAEMFDLEVYAQKKIKPPVNKSVRRYDREALLSESYVMPLKPFIEHTEVAPDANEALLHTKDEQVVLSLHLLNNSYLLFAKDGKPLKEDGPVHLYFADGSNKDEPIKGIQTIEIR